MASKNIIRPLENKVALVTGASRGIGRGIALQLGQAGAIVYLTGRAPSNSFSQNELPSLEQTAKEIKDNGGNSHPIYCDHSKTEEVRSLFKRIEQEQGGRLNILVNNAYSGAPSLMKNAGKKFWECEPEFWDDINEVGLRNAYFCSTFAARLMVPKGDGLIVNISSAGSLQYLFSVPYGVGKTAIDRMTADMGFELKPFGVTCVSLWPSFVRTELATLEANEVQFSKAAGMTTKAFKNSLATAETTDFVGKAVVGLASDPNKIKKTGRIHITEDLATEYGFTDKNGVTPSNFRSVRSALEFLGWVTLAKIFPKFLKVPKWALHFSSYKF
ncbi:unnamed protein product [Meloidogyne enterolobii]|uniref:Uncharacterized protein n=1 Tax=Meloidogyne enterolobii TaxID=390850 RepID=A0ACB0ZQI2_MELEN